MGLAGWGGVGLLVLGVLVYLVNGVRLMKAPAIRKAEVVRALVGQVVFIVTPGGTKGERWKRTWGVLVSVDGRGVVYRDREHRERFLSMPAVLALEDFQGRTIAEF